MTNKDLRSQILGAPCFNRDCVGQSYGSHYFHNIIVNAFILLHRACFMQVRWNQQLLRKQIEVLLATACLTDTF
jgi:hypothetical protein